MNIRFALSTYNRPDLLKQCVNAALNSTVPVNEVLVIDNSPEQYATEILYEYLFTYKVYVFHQLTNIGLSGAWNWFFENYDDYLIFPNDDVIVHPRTIEA